VSFELYGPIFSVSKTATNTYNEVTVKPIGKYIYFHGQYYGVKILSYDGSVVVSIKDTNDFARLWTLHLLRLNATQVEHYFGYGDGQSPRCPPATGTCGAEFEKCTDDGTCTVLCTGPRYNCDQGNFGAPFYDAKTKYIFVDGHCTGGYIYKYTPEGYVDSWKPAEIPLNGGSGILAYDETYFYLLVMTGTSPDRSNLYRCKWDVLRTGWKQTTYVVDQCELVASNLPCSYNRNTQTLELRGGWIVDYSDGTTWYEKVLKARWNA
jgi:hypothetical protein